MSTETVLLFVQLAALLGMAMLCHVAVNAAEGARRHRDRVDEERRAWQNLARECQTATLRCDNIESQISSLREQHQRLQGKFYATMRGKQAEQAEEQETPDEARARLRAQHGLPRIGPNGA